MPRSIRIAALQLRAHDRADFTRVWPSMLGRIASAARSANLLVLPEGTIPGYVLGDAPVDDTEIASAVAELRALAAEVQTVIVLGIAARGSNGGLFNRALAIESDGTLAGSADKIFLWDFDRKWFQPGGRIAPVETSLGRLGLLVCADGRMPEIARALAEAGSELLVMPTAWVTSGRDPASLENAQADLLARVRAFENKIAFVAANKCGSELGVAAYCGKSQIIDANGELMAIASQDSEEVIYADVQPRRALPFRSTHRPTFRNAASSGDVRVAIALDSPTVQSAAHLNLLDAISLDAVSDAILLNDDELFDPGALVQSRLDGCRVAIWSVRTADPWTQRIACVRALELRMYVVVLDYGSDRAYAIDPDGRIIAGTFAAYRTATFWFDAAKTQQTAIVSGTDVLSGLARVRAILERQNA